MYSTLQYKQFTVKFYRKIKRESLIVLLELFYLSYLHFFRRYIAKVSALNTNLI